MATAIPVPEPEFGPSDLEEGVTLKIPNSVYHIESTAISSNIGFSIVPHPLLPNQTALKVVYQNETGPCTYSNAVVRRAKAQRKLYIDALKYLMDKPSLVIGIPATQSYYSDFAFLHVNYARFVHFNGNFHGATPDSLSRLFTAVASPPKN